MRFGPLTIGYDARVLRPRPWTERQSAWAASLLPGLPPGPVLELCCGAGHIGLLAVLDSDRPLVQVDRSPEACAWARANAARAGRAVDVREGDLEEALDPDERFALVIADPPWVPHAAIGTFPEDPPLAIDGGADGLDLARRCVAVAAAHLVEGGQVLLQLGTAEQVASLAPSLAPLGLAVTGQSAVPGSGVLVQRGVDDDDRLLERVLA